MCGTYKFSTLTKLYSFQLLSLGFIGKISNFVPDVLIKRKLSVSVLVNNISVLITD